MKWCHAAVLSGVVLASLGSYADPSNALQYSKSDIRRMMREARTVDQYHALADYFRSQQQHLERQAQAEKEEWQRRSQNTSSLAAKYPRPADSSRNRYEYFSYEAQEMQRQAAHYDDLAASAK
jgi:hypothetical protein